MTRTWKLKLNVIRLFSIFQDLRPKMWCHDVMTSHSWRYAVTGKIIVHSTFIIQRSQTFSKNIVINAFINVYYYFWNVYHIYVLNYYSFLQNYSCIFRWKTGPKIQITLLEFHWYLVCVRKYNTFYLDFFENFTTISGFAAAILEFGMLMQRPRLCHLIAQTYLWKVTKGYLSTTCGSEMAAKRSDWV